MSHCQRYTTFCSIQSAAAAGREKVLLRLLELCSDEAAVAVSGCSLLHLLAECGESTQPMDAAVKSAALRQPIDAKAKLPGLEGWTALVGYSR